MIDKSFHYLILIILGGVLMVLLKLSFEHWRFGEICPNLLGFPACYILSIAVLLAILSHLKIFNDKETFFFLGAGLAWAVALTASVLQTTGRIECPKTLGNFPLCYLSLIIFSTVFILRICLFIFCPKL